MLALQRNSLTYFQTVELAADLDELPCVVDVRFRFERARDLSIKDPATTFSHGTGYNYFRRVADRGRGRIEADLALTNQPPPSFLPLQSFNHAQNGPDANLHAQFNARTTLHPSLLSPLIRVFSDKARDNSIHGTKNESSLNNREPFRNSA